MNPTVVALMLTSDRHKLAKKAVTCFRAQTYPLASLLVFDSGEQRLEMERQPQEFWCDAHEFSGAPIGKLRNAAIWLLLSADVIVHWDDDDYSHPTRITEQVELLQASGADVVGYNQMLFWRTQPSRYRDGQPHPIGMVYCPCGEVFPRTAGTCPTCKKMAREEAWLYTHQDARPYALGTSLCYKRSFWERHQFAAETQGVEDHWLREKNLLAVSALVGPDKANPETTCDPRMIARIHGGNTSNGYKLEEYVAKGSREWKRVPFWDSRVREILG